MLILLIATAISAALLVELGLMVASEIAEASRDRWQDERQMNDAFKTVSLKS